MRREIRRIELTEEREKQQAEQREAIRKQELTNQGRRVPETVGEQVGQQMTWQEGEVRRDLEDKGLYFSSFLS